jgi:hypothetical protein
MPVVARLTGILCVVTDSSGKGTNSADERLQGWVREDFGVQLSSIDRVEHGADAAAEVWRGIAVDGSQYAVEWSGGDTDAGLLVTAHLAATGVPGILGPRRPAPAGRCPGGGAGDHLEGESSWMVFPSLGVTDHASPQTRPGPPPAEPTGFPTMVKSGC